MGIRGVIGGLKSKYQNISPSIFQYLGFKPHEPHDLGTWILRGKVC